MRGRARAIGRDAAADRLGVGALVDRDDPVFPLGRVEGLAHARHQLAVGTVEGVPELNLGDRGGGQR